MSRPEFSCSASMQFLPEQSQPPEGPFAFAYKVSIRNSGDIAAQLVARHWVVIDAEGHREDVRGLAVAGQQPLLKPGELHEYTSWLRIPTPQGRMHGTFFCMTEDAHGFEATVPEFELLFPGSLLH